MTRNSQRSTFNVMWAIQVLPLVLVLLFLLGTIFLFILGPMQWPGRGDITLKLFLAAAVGAVIIGYGIGLKGDPDGQSIPFWRWIIIVGGLLSFALLFPSSYYYAGKMPWQVLDAMQDQSAAYYELAERLRQTAGQRAFISLARTATYPVVFAVMPLGVIKWREMTWWLWIFWTLAVMSSAVFSVLRGTDREVFDIIIVGSAAVLIAIGRELLAKEWTIRRLLVRPRVLVGCIAAVAILAVALGMFVERRVQRANMVYGQIGQLVELDRGWTSALCVRATCPDRYHPFFQPFGPLGKYGVVMLTGYLTQGYHGLSLALRSTDVAKSTWGIGHSQALRRIYKSLTGNTSLYERGYTYRLKTQDWDDGLQWSTIFPWIANDVGFVGTIGVMGLLAMFWGKTWRDAIGAYDDVAAVAFCFVFQLFMYAPANNQLAQTLDAYVAFALWVLWWLFTRPRIRAMIRRHISWLYSKSRSTELLVPREYKRGDADRKNTRLP